MTRRETIAYVCDGCGSISYTNRWVTLTTHDPGGSWPDGSNDEPITTVYDYCEACHRLMKASTPKYKTLLKESRHG